MKIAYCTKTDPLDKTAWSGTHYFILHQLCKFADVQPIGPLSNRWLKPFKGLNRISQMLSGRGFQPNHLPVVCKKYAREIETRLEDQEFDFLFFPAGAELISQLHTDIPIVYLSDATYNLMHGYYPDFSSLWPFASKHGDYTEQSAISKSVHLIFSSKWAANSAIKFYGKNADAVSVVPFGANIDLPPSSQEVFIAREASCNRLRSGPLRLLWVGVDWARKGGDLACRVAEELISRGYDAQLNIVGRYPHEVARRAYIKAHGFLDKNDPEQRATLSKIYMQADLFLFPSARECSAIALAEAACFGLPAVAFKTGGLADYVMHEHTGYLLAEGASCDDFVDAVLAITANYTAFSQNSRSRYAEVNSWAIWGAEVRSILEGLSTKTTIG